MLYRGGCGGRGTTATYCLCFCHIDGQPCTEASCKENGKPRKVVSFFRSDALDAPVEAKASDHYTFAKPNRSSSKVVRRHKPRGRKK